MKALVVLTVDLPTPDDVVDVLEHIDPPNVPHFAGDARIVVGPYVDVVLNYLDGDE
jgi:hypothetical protein